MAKDEAYYRAQIRKKGKEIDRLNARNTDLNGQLERIKRARDAVKEAKDYYKKLQKNTKNIANEKYQWKGQQYKKGKNKLDELVQWDATAVADIDGVLDTLERDIGRIEREIMNNTGLIGELTNGINWLWHEINAAIN